MADQSAIGKILMQDYEKYEILQLSEKIMTDYPTIGKIIMQD